MSLARKPSPNHTVLLGLEGYQAARPWGAPAAVVGVDYANIEEIPPFPTTQELDNEFDGWPMSGNPLIARETQINHPNKEPIVLSATPVTALTVAQLVADIIRSEDKLFFISYSQERSQ
jgi:hypothetical protein